MTYQEQIKAIEDYMDASLGVNGEITKKAEEAIKEMKAASGDLISRQAAIDATIEAADDWDGGCSKERERFIRDALEKLPSAQSDHIAEVSKKDIPSVQSEQAAREMKAESKNEPIVPNDVNFWCERARYYESVCCQLMADIAKGVTLDSMSINENGITFTKSKEPVKEMKTGSDGDCISRKQALDLLLKREKELREKNWFMEPKFGYECVGVNWCTNLIYGLPSIFPTQMSGTLEKQVSILADALNGCPLTDPCDKLWAPHGWCEEHCGENQEPSKECWLKYAEVMTREDL